MSDNPRCHGEGEVEVGTVRDEFGNWDTETFRCPGCPDCAMTIVEKVARVQWDFLRGRQPRLLPFDETDEDARQAQYALAKATVAALAASQCPKCGLDHPWMCGECGQALEPVQTNARAATATPQAGAEREGSNPKCERLLVGQGTDTYDPLCQLPEGHTGPCRGAGEGAL